MTGAVVGGMLGLVAFLMAFSIGITIGHHSERKNMVITEANAIRCSLAPGRFSRRNGFRVIT